MTSRAAAPRRMTNPMILSLAILHCLNLMISNSNDCFQFTGLVQDISRSQPRLGEHLIEIKRPLNKNHLPGIFVAPSRDLGFVFVIPFRCRPKIFMRWVVARPFAISREPCGASRSNKSRGASQLFQSRFPLPTRAFFEWPVALHQKVQHT